MKGIRKDFVLFGKLVESVRSLLDGLLHGSSIRPSPKSNCVLHPNVNADVVRGLISLYNRLFIPYALSFWELVEILPNAAIDNLYKWSNREIESFRFKDGHDYEYKTWFKVFSRIVKK